MGLLFHLAPRLQAAQADLDPQPIQEDTGASANERSALGNIEPPERRRDAGPWLRSATFAVEGLSCRSCAHRAELLLSRVPGVRRAHVSFVGELAHVVIDTRVCSETDVARAMDTVGHRLHPASLGAPSARAEVAGARLLTAGVLLANLAAVVAGGATRARGGSWAAIALAGAALVVAAPPLLRRARALGRRGAALEDLSAALAAAICLLVALGARLLPHVGSPWLGRLGFGSRAWEGAADYACLAAAAIAFFALAGRALSAWARRRAIGDLGELPVSTRRIAADGTEQLTPAETLDLGDRVRMLQGERAPADIRLEAPARVALPSRGDAGETTVTSEAGALVPMGAQLLSGTAVGVVVDPLARIERARDAEVERAIAQVDPHTLLAWGRCDFLGALGRALGTATVALAGFALIAHGVLGGGVASPMPWLALAAVLAAASAAPLSLAAPIARVRAIVGLRRRRVVVREPAALEALSAIDHVCVEDAAGLTSAEVRVAGVAWTSDSPDRAVLEEVMASVEHAQDANSRAVAAYLAIRGIAPAAPRLSEHAGASLVAAPESAPARVHGDRDPASVASLPAGRAWFGRAGLVLGYFELEATLTAQAIATVRALAARGVRCTLIARGEGAADKALAVRDAQHGGACVAFIGDGSATTAAAAADVSVAVAPSAHPADVRAGVIVGSLEAVLELIEMAHAARARVRRCLLLCAGYNAIVLPLAVSGSIGPLAASAAGLLLAVVGLRVATAPWRAANAGAKAVVARPPTRELATVGNDGPLGCPPGRLSTA